MASCTSLNRAPVASVLSPALCIGSRRHLTDHATRLSYQLPPTSHPRPAHCALLPSSVTAGTNDGPRQEESPRKRDLPFLLCACAMESRRAPGGGNREEKEEGRKELALCVPLPPPPHHPHRALSALRSGDVKLAAVAVGLRVRPRAADMPPPMQERAFRCTRSLVEAAPDRRNPNLTLIALALKKEFDASYGPAWHCVVGRSFGSYLTHSLGGFVYFSLDGGDDANLSLLLFQTHLQPL